MMNFSKFVFSIVICLVLSLGAIVPAYAVNDYTDDEMRDICTDQWRVLSGISHYNMVSGDALHDLAATWNDRDFPCEVVYVSSLGEYAIRATGPVYFEGRFVDITGRYLTTETGFMYTSRDLASSESLGIIVRNVNSLVDGMTKLLDALTGEDDLFHLWFTLFKTQLEMLDTDLRLIRLDMTEKFDELIAAVKGLSINVEGDTISIDNMPVVDAIKALHSDFNDYFAQFGSIIDYENKMYDLTGETQIEWDSRWDGVTAASLTPGSQVYSYVMPDLTSGFEVSGERFPTITGNFENALSFYVDGETIPFKLEVSLSNLIPNGNFDVADRGAWAGGGGQITVSSGRLQFMGNPAYAAVYLRYPMTFEDASYLVLFDGSASVTVPSAYQLEFAGADHSFGEYSLTTSAQTFSFFGKPSPADGQIKFRTVDPASFSSNFYTYYDNVQFFNLTSTFGLGFEPDSLADFRKIFPDAYYQDAVVDLTSRIEYISYDGQLGWYASVDGVQIGIPADMAAALNAVFAPRLFLDASSISFGDGVNHVYVTNDGTLHLEVMSGNKIVAWYVNWQYESRYWLEDLLDTTGGMGADIQPILDKLTAIENALSNMGGDINIENNIDVDIPPDNDNYNIFYVTDPDTGEDLPITEVVGDVLGLVGQLFNFLFQASFDSALSNGSGSIGHLDDFYFDSTPGSDNVWDS